MVEERPIHPLRAWRKRTRVSVIELADEIKVTRATIERYECGRLPRQPYLDRIVVVTNGEVTANAWLGKEAIIAIQAARCSGTDMGAA